MCLGKNPFKWGTSQNFINEDIDNKEKRRNLDVCRTKSSHCLPLLFSSKNWWQHTVGLTLQFLKKRKKILKAKWSKQVVAGKELIQVLLSVVGKWTGLVKNGKTTRENGVCFLSEVVLKILYSQVKAKIFVIILVTLNQGIFI